MLLKIWAKYHDMAPYSSVQRTLCCWFVPGKMPTTEINKLMKTEHRLQTKVIILYENSFTPAPICYHNITWRHTADRQSITYHIASASRITFWRALIKTPFFFAEYWFHTFITNKEYTTSFRQMIIHWKPSNCHIVLQSTYTDDKNMLHNIIMTHKTQKCCEHVCGVLIM
jgi:hypothetical protein